MKKNIVKGINSINKEASYSLKEFKAIRVRQNIKEKDKIIALSIVRHQQEKIDAIQKLEEQE